METAWVRAASRRPKRKEAYMVKHVYDFAEGSKEMLDLLGGKGANLAEMTNIGLPVPPGFTITTEACRTFLQTGAVPVGLDQEVSEHLTRLENEMGKKLGDPENPLLVSVRSGAKFSMPGMMDTVLDIGLNDESINGLIKQSGDERFAWDSYRRLVQMFGKTVMGVDGSLFEHALSGLKAERKAKTDLDLDISDLKGLVATFKAIVKSQTGRDFPVVPREQLDAAILAVFNSWNGERARIYRRQERIADDLGTAVTVISMVFGNLNLASGTGVAFTRDPASGNPGVYGDYLQDAQGEDVVAGIRNTMPLQDLEQLNEPVYRQLLQTMSTLERHYRDLCDIEFTVENGKLWMLQTRVGKRTAAAAFRIASQLVEENVISMDEALGRVSGAGLAELMFPRFDESSGIARLATGMGASPGAAVGKVVFDSPAAVAWAAKGERVILVRTETNPDDLPGMIAAKGILTRRGGKTSHAAVVARGMGKTCVVAASEITIDFKARSFTAPDGTVIAEGDLISIDGKSGAVYKGEVPVVASPLVRYFEGTFDPATADSETRGLVAAVEQLLRHADARRHLSVRANADMPEDAVRARAFGAEGIGLCRTEHMFLGERRKLVERLVLAGEDEVERNAALDALLPLQRTDFIAILEAMDGLPVTIRLIDPPLHEFLPDLTELSLRAALARGRRRTRCRSGKAPAGGPPPPRGQPDVGLARCEALPRHPGPCQPPGSGHRRSRGREDQGRWQPAARDHGPCRGGRPRARARKGNGRKGYRRRCRRDRHPPGKGHRHDDRAAKGVPHRRAYRQLGRLFLLRHQRPHADDLGVLPGRLRSLVLPPLYGPWDIRHLAVRDPRQRRCGHPGADGRRDCKDGQARDRARGLRRARRRP